MPVIKNTMLRALGLFAIGLWFQPCVGQNCFIKVSSHQYSNMATDYTYKQVELPGYYQINKYNLIPGENSLTEIQHKKWSIDSPGHLNPRTNKPAGVSAGIRYIWSTGSIDRSIMISSSLSYFITHQIELEVNIARDLKDGRHFSTGGRFHLNSRKSVKRLTPFTGVLLGVEYGEGFIQIPLGLNYLTYAGFETSLGINELFYINSWKTTFLEFRLGWRFKLKN